MGVKDVLTQEGYRIVGETRHAKHIAPIARRQGADVVVLATEINGRRTTPVVRSLTAGLGKQVIAVAGPSLHATADAEEFLTAGADAVAVGAFEPDELVVLLRRVLAGEEGLVFVAPVHVEDGGLTPRELAVLGAAARGLRNEEIARELTVTPNTVKHHLDEIYRKIGVRNRMDALRWSIRHGVVRR
jgi:two-component system response regulator DesR